MAEFIILALATFRVSWFITDPHQEGPGNFKTILANRIGLCRDPNAPIYKAYLQPTTSLQKWWTCQVCNSVAIAAALTLCLQHWSTAWIVYAFAASQVAIFISEARS